MTGKLTPETSLDPEDWDAFRETAHAALETAINHMQGRADAPVWQAVPDEIKQRLQADLPMDGKEPDQIIAQIQRDFLPHDVGNTHPRFFGWVHGSGTASGVIPDIFAAAMNANLGGRDHVANYVEKQVVSWCREGFGFPETAGGLIVSGTSMATLIALKSARDKATNMDARASGIQGAAKNLVGYASAQAHSCIARTFDIIGLGSDALRAIPVDADFRMNVPALQSTIEQDTKGGLQPFCLVGTAGTVNTGAIDPLNSLADIARQNGLWFHIDGAFGALAILSEKLKPRLRGIERANSLAFDFHKWMHVNYDAGMVLMRDTEDQRRAFSSRPEYLTGNTRGLAAGNPWSCDYGPELSRGFRALKIWYQMKEHGLSRIGEKIAENCDQAGYLASLVAQNTALAILAPASLNIVCFRYQPGGLSEQTLDQLNTDIVVELQERGLAAPSTTRINGSLAIRVNITNHRTTRADIDYLIENVLIIGNELASAPSTPKTEA